MKHYRKSIIGTVLLLSIYQWSTAAEAEVAVIIHPSSAVAAVTSEDIERVFLGKSSTLPGNVKVDPVDQSEESLSRNEFYRIISGKSAGELKAYWSKRIFTGKGTPPNVVGDDTAVRDWIADHPAVIGYVNSRAVDDSVKVLLMIP